MPKKKLRFKTFYSPVIEFWNILEENPEYTLEGLDRRKSINAILEMEDNYFRQQKKALHYQDWETYLTSHTERKLLAFLYIQEVLNDEDFFNYFTFSIINSDENWKHRDELLKLIKKRAGKQTFFHNSKDKKCFSKLPNEFKIFRGCNKLNKEGLNWSLSHSCAKKFATKFIKNNLTTQTYNAGANCEESKVYNKYPPIVIHGTCKNVKAGVKMYHLAA